MICSHKINNNSAIQFPKKTVAITINQKKLCEYKNQRTYIGREMNCPNPISSSPNTEFVDNLLVRMEKYFMGELNDQ